MQENIQKIKIELINSQMRKKKNTKFSVWRPKSRKIPNHHAFEPVSSKTQFWTLKSKKSTFRMIDSCLHCFQLLNNISGHRTYFIFRTSFLMSTIFTTNTKSKSLMILQQTVVIIKYITLQLYYTNLLFYVFPKVDF